MFGWFDFTTLGIVAAAIGIAWFIPPLRRYAIAAGALAVVVFTIYRKGKADQAALERKRRDEAVRRAKEQYDEIDRRPDTVDDVVKRLRNNGF